MGLPVRGQNTRSQVWKYRDSCANGSETDNLVDCDGEEAQQDGTKVIDYLHCKIMYKGDNCIIGVKGHSNNVGNCATIYQELLQLCYSYHSSFLVLYDGITWSHMRVTTGVREIRCIQEAANKLKQTHYKHLLQTAPLFSTS
jgi:hypothetical protein